jgi:uncharacterized Zn finger protein
MRIELACAECGKNNFAFPDGGGDNAIVSCGDCGHILGSMGDLKQAVAEAVITKSRKANLLRTTRDHDAR